jgi:hypothetical protein
MRVAYNCFSTCSWAERATVIEQAMPKLTRREALRGAAAIAAAAAVPLPVAPRRIFREPTGPPLRVAAAVPLPAPCRVASNVRTLTRSYSEDALDRIARELDQEMHALSGLTDGRFDAVAEG